ncbi:hypothetical protein [Spirosoma validum]|uniref:Uncharacterized protein n=1 Tax=Spirosoma validum TaxID=2771355 RepID=A0A927B920_9BACT|nr:hypothetical protein [Spirosoma validum]MBD2757427.1 hypothetical protein [Spirosoma validum]
MEFTTQFQPVMEDDLRKLVHDLRGYHGIICFALDVLERKPTKGNQEVFQEMLARNLARSQSMLTDSASYTWPKDSFGSASELRIELTRLLHYLQTKKRIMIPHQIQDQIDSLITTLLSIGSRGL